MQSDTLLRVRYVADKLGFTTAYIYQLIKEGKLKGIKVGERAVRISESELTRYIQEQNNG